MIDVRCYICNKDMSIFEITRNDETEYQVQIETISNKHYIIYKCKTLEEAKKYVKQLENEVK